MTRWGRVAAGVVIVVGAALFFVDVGYGVGLLGLALFAGALAAVRGASADGTVDLRPRADEDGVTWSDRRGRVVESVRWEDVERVRAWTRVLWTGNGLARYQHHLDVITHDGDHPLRTVHRRRSTPSLDDLLTTIRKQGVTVEDDRRFGMWESARRGV